MLSSPLSPQHSLSSSFEWNRDQDKGTVPKTLVLQLTEGGPSAGWFSQELTALNLEGTSMLCKVTNIQIVGGKPESKTCLGCTEAKGKRGLVLNYHAIKCTVECRYNTR
jgi:hypothetical protein